MGLLADLEDKFRLDEVERFLHFFRVLADNFEPSVVKLSADETRYKEGLSELGALTHNLAWAAKPLKLGEIVNFCELCEKMLDEAAKLKGPASDEFVEWLLLVSEQFARYCESFEQDNLALAAFNPALAAIPQSLSK